MPKINVYLPDDLAETVKDLNIPVSAICQRALEGSIKRITSIRALTIQDLTEGTPRTEQLTQRLVSAIRQGAQGAFGPQVTTADLAMGLVREGGNLALEVLRAIDIEPATLPSSLLAPNKANVPVEGFASDAANALELAVIEAIALGHNYVGCEHLLLGLIAEPDGPGGQVLRERGAELKSTRRAVQTALAGIVHVKKAQQSTPDAAKILEMVMSRLARLEQHVGIG